MARPTVCAIFAGLLMFALAPQVRAGDGCSVADLNGDYSFVLSGTVVGANAPGLPTGPFAAAGETIYHGDGYAEGVIQVSVNGGQLYSKWTATYTPNTTSSPSTCSFTKAITLKATGTTATYFITAGDDFKELRFVEIDSGTVITGTARKQ